MVTSAVPSTDLFISYARLDNEPAATGGVTSIVNAIATEFRRFAGRELRWFMDTSEIRTMDDWEEKIHDALAAAPVMLVVLSPRFVESRYCRKEWRVFLEHEIRRGMFGRNIQSVYYIKVDDPADADADAGVKKRLIKDLRDRRQLSSPAEILKPWHDGGLADLQRADVRARLVAMAEQIHTRGDETKAALNSPTNVPEYNPNFVGRVEDLRALRQIFQESAGNIAGIAGVQGLGGIGKTELAFAYAHAYAARYRGGRFLVKAERMTDFLEVMLELSGQFGLERTRLAELLSQGRLEDVKKAFREALMEHCAQRAAGGVSGKAEPAVSAAALDPAAKVLVILDNVARPPGQLDGVPPVLNAGRIRDLLPEPARSLMHIVVTSRLEPTSLGMSSCLRVDALEDDDALRLLERHRGFRGKKEEPAAIQIVELLGGHALALEVVAIHLSKHSEKSYETFLEYIKHNVITAVDTAGRDPDMSPFRNQQLVDKLMVPLLAPTLDALPPAERMVLDFASLCPPDTVPMHWIREIAGQVVEELGKDAPPGADDPWLLLRRRLEGLRLITGDITQPLARMHRIVRAVVAEGLKPEAREGMEQLLHDGAVSKAAPLEEGTVLPEQEPDLEACVGFAQLWLVRGTVEAALLGGACVRALARRADAIAAKRLALVAHEVFQRRVEQAPGDLKAMMHLSVSCENIGDLDRSTGNHPSALHFYRASLGNYERLVESAPGDVSIQRNMCVPLLRIGDLERASGNVDAARSRFQRVYEIVERLAKSLPNDVQAQRAVSVSCNRMGDLERAAGNVDAARAFFQRGLEIAERLAKALPTDVQAQRDLSVSCNKMGDLERAAGNVDAARAFFHRDFEIAERLAKTMPTDVQAQRELAVSYFQCGRLEAATGNNEAAALMLFKGNTQLRHMRDSGMPLDPAMKQLLAKLDALDGPSGSDANPDAPGGGGG